MIKCEEVIITDLETRGKGTEYSVVRRITQVYQKDGQLIAEYDPTPDTYTKTDMVHFANYVLKQGKQTVTEKTVNSWLDTIKL